VKDVSEFTGFPEMLDGRVKTLHPRVHAGILSVRDNPAHVATMNEHGLGYIDLVCVNLYPSCRPCPSPTPWTTPSRTSTSAARPWCGPRPRTISTWPSSPTRPTTPALVEEMKANGGALGDATRFNLAKKAFTHTAQYDGHISNYLTSLNAEGGKDRSAKS
jgi:phosphoribosylaminoimidazolecarboxamide formyltransferase/IMP cyclohydrolase